MASIFDTELVKWAGVIIAAPVAYVWKRAVGAAQKEEVKEAVQAMQAALQAHAEEDSRRFTGLFARMDEVAKSTARIEGYMQAQRDQQHQR